jgi:uridylate kinase
MGEKCFDFDTDMIARYAHDMQSVTNLGVQETVVIGVGNIRRGMNKADTGIKRAHGNYMGMLSKRLDEKMPVMYSIKALKL